MAFPSSPSNGDIATVANVIYSYNSSKSAWIRLRSDGTYLTVNTLAVTSANVSNGQLFGALIVAGGVGIGGNLHAGTIQGTPIGNTSPSSGKFTVLESMGDLTVSNGALIVSTGGMTAAGNIATTGNITASGNLTATQATLSGNLISGNVSTGIIAATNNITTSANVNSTYVTATSRVSANNVNNTGQFYYNTRTVSANVTIGATENAMSVGPMTIADGVEVVIADGGEWSIV
jgi:hypothetical protein